MKKFILWFFIVGGFPAFFLAGFPGFSGAQDSGSGGLTARKATDYIHAVVQGSRSFYTKQIVERLDKAISLKASENWEQDNALPLPAQFMLLSAKQINDKGMGLKIRLIGLHPINKKNAPVSDLEKLGLHGLATNPEEPFTWVIQTGGRWNFQAIYPDIAVSEACVNCHNAHPESPKKDFKVGDVLGGLVINIPLRQDGISQKEDNFLVPPEIISDYIHAILDSDRSVYASLIVNRMHKANVVQSAENWQESNQLPLPAQFLINSSGVARQNKLGLDFRLISLWPINVQNGAANEFERNALEAVSRHPLRPFISKIKLGARHYFQGVYPDFAVSPSCVNCHNAHPKSPRKDFTLNDLMGAIVVSFPIQ